MKLLAGLLWANITLGTSAASGEASIYIQDDATVPQGSKIQSISPQTARLLFAQRLGLSQYHDLGDADETTLQILNTYGGKQRSVFGDAEESRPQVADRLLFIVEGVEFPEGGLRAPLN